MANVAQIYFAQDAKPVYVLIKTAFSKYTMNEIDCTEEKKFGVFRAKTNPCFFCAFEYPFLTFTDNSFPHSFPFHTKSLSAYMLDALNILG